MRAGPFKTIIKTLTVEISPYRKKKFVLFEDIKNLYLSYCMADGKIHFDTVRVSIYLYLINRPDSYIWTY